jgi:hypothetical protein
MFKKLIGIWVIVLILGAMSLANRHPPQPLSPEWKRDFARRVIDACDRLPVGAPNRPDEIICSQRGTVTRSAQGCDNDLVLGRDRCLELQAKIEAHRPCAEMVRLGLREDADRCFWQTRELLK